ncbi:hypothetical protein [Pedobacter frigoris]|uniref:hypothetical protein n=1 Tax=Pedobacter frigoris TaxID=2571272 RepID=UPI00292FC49B|nr:hypothetical protein [Pedobacter frigoris]
MKRLSAIGIILVALCILLDSCSSTKLVSSWTAKDVTIPQSSKVLVIALMGNKDRKLRENVENSIVENLKTHGVSAGSALAEYGPKDFDGLDEKVAVQKIKEKGYDGAFTIALLDKTKSKSYVPGGFGIMPYPYGFWGYYRPMYARVYEPGYYQVTNKFMLEANFFNLVGDKLVYSAQTKTINPDSPQSLASEFSKTLFEDMVKKGVIK